MEVEGGLRVSINEKNKTAIVIHSPNATGIVLVPRFAVINNIKYKIISIKGYAFEGNKIDFLTFPEDSEIESFDSNCFVRAHIKKLRIPPKLKELGICWCQYLYDLTDIEISPQNHNFIYFDNKYLLQKSQDASDDFYILQFASNDIEEAVIPAQVKTIGSIAFFNRTKLKTVVTPPNSKLECINGAAFEMCPLEKLEATSKSIVIKNYCFLSCKNLSVLSFPNAEQIELGKDILKSAPEKVKILVKRDAKLAGDGVKQYQKNISYIDEKRMSETTLKKTEKTDNKSEVITANNRHEKTIEELEKENEGLKKYSSFLVSRLSRYEECISYDDFLKGESINDENEEEAIKVTFIGAEDEEFQEVVRKIGEGGTSEVFKVIDKRTGEVMCKKVIKEVSDEFAFKTLQNSVKEIEIGQSIHHPCICESLGYNMQEKLPQNTKDEDESDDDDDDDEKQKEEKVAKTTIALFFELLPFSVKDVIEKDLMSNTLKVRVAVEVAFGMSHLHSRGMMHRDLKLENVMMNSVFESKVIDFGLVHASDMSSSGSSLTKGVGTLAYMSPEMVNEEEYDNKTDVYSYGIVLFVLFTGRLPKQSMRDKMTNVPMKYPKASSKISEFCVDLIKRCTAFKASARPSFDEIIEDMHSHSFELASEVDKKLIFRRYKELNRFRSLHSKASKK